MKLPRLARIENKIDQILLRVTALEHFKSKVTGAAGVVTLGASYLIAKAFGK